MNVGTNIHEQSRSDFCKLRFNTELVSRIYALNQHMKLPGIIVYNSGTVKSTIIENIVTKKSILIPSFNNCKLKEDLWNIIIRLTHRQWPRNI